MDEKSTILQLGAEILRQKAQRVDDFDCDKFKLLLERLQREMLEHNGVGIAAPQIGESWQIVIVASRPTPRYPHAPEMQPEIMVNPEFELVDDFLVKDWEGCLSVPGVRALVPRYRAVQVLYQNTKGSSCQKLLRDFPARVFQHEYDHLQGLVYLDKVETNRDIISESEFLKRIAA